MFGLTLPDGDYFPSQFSKRRPVPHVPVNVGFKLLKPIFAIARWTGAVDTSGMLVPKATMHEYHRFVPAKHYVGFSRKIGTMQPEP